MHKRFEQGLGKRLHIETSGPTKKTIFEASESRNVIYKSHDMEIQCINRRNSRFFFL